MDYTKEMVTRFERAWKSKKYSSQDWGINQIKGILGNLKPEKGSHFNDWGCGDGRVSKYLCDNGFYVHGFDFVDVVADKDVSGFYFSKEVCWRPSALVDQTGYSLALHLLECLPTPNEISETLFHIMRTTREAAVFTISVEPDSIGPVIVNAPLTVTVQGPSWWVDLVKRNFDKELWTLTWGVDLNILTIIVTRKPAKRKG
jgi:hypothetical protein